MVKKPHGPDPIVNAALSLAAERGWRGLALADIAERAKVPLTEVVEHFNSKADILDAYIRRIDQRMLEGGIEAGESPRDRLFDIIMRRFDAMAGDRRALRTILRQSGDDPWAVLCGGTRFLKSMALTLETGGISSSGLRGLALIHGLTAVYLYAFKTFLDDDSEDHARTMAALDKALRRAEDFSSFIWRRRAPPQTTPTPDFR
ncbi:MAG: helix-turn-helix transcriptional regulator [Rhodospirillaceae bacterium]|nr:helix-turn-helix transcriptional regulator [Rhodospirillales bacterium]